MSTRECKQLYYVLLRVDYSVVQSRRDGQTATLQFMDTIMSACPGSTNVRFPEHHRFLTDANDLFSDLMNEILAVLAWRETSNAKDTDAGTGGKSKDKEVMLAFDQGKQDNTKRFEVLRGQLNKFANNSGNSITRPTFEAHVGGTWA